MRPKIVASVLLLAIGVVTLVLLVKGLAPGPLSPTAGSQTTAAPPAILARDGKGTVAPSGEKGALAPAAGSPPASSKTTGNASVAPPAASSAGSNTVIARTFEQERASRIQSDLDQISDAVVSGKDDPLALNKILDRITSPDPEVSRAALSAVVYSDDPAAIDRLKEILSQTEDPRTKTAIMDAMELMTPVPDPFEGVTNAPPDGPPHQRTAPTKATRGRPPGASPRPVKAPTPPGR